MFRAAGILVQNSSAADELGLSIRVNALSQFGVEVNMWRFWNGLANGSSIQNLY